MTNRPRHRDGWIYEEKVDGWRILAYKDGARAFASAAPARLPRLAAGA